MSESLTVTRTVDATPEQLFAVLSHPERHEDLDGSSMLRGLEAPIRLTGVGDEFVMKMHNDALGDYRMRNTVTEFEQDRKIGWAPALDPIDGYTDKVGDMRGEGHTYTWILEPDGDGTKVTQVYDWSGVKDDTFRGFFPMLTEQQLAESIEKAAAAATES
ncbi:SRPBCC family protein [Pseudonocardia phyllosphaerae]|uniref:SRPBCC family protein n=1 Tax=Pseudonocardia phyllosphaerae TaxID=3390502 RepID=UPI00397E412E